MEELKSLVKGLEEADANKLVEDIPKIMGLVKQVGFLQVVQDEDLKDFIEELREKMGDIDVEALIPLAKLVMPTLFEGMQELLTNSEEAKEEMAEMEDITLEIAVPEIDFYMNIQIKDGSFSGGEGKLPDAELKVGVKRDVFLNLVKGEGDLVSAYMAGGMTLEGPLNKAMILQSLFEIMSDEYEFDVGIF